MNIYKITFSRNEVFFCEDVSDRVLLNGLYHFELANGELLYGFVRATSEDNALTLAQVIGNKMLKDAQKHS